jgi:hypothetical protein
MKRLNKTMIVLVILGSFAFTSACAQEEAHSEVTENLQEIGRVLLEVRIALEQAANYAAMGMTGFNPDDSGLYAQALINILEGPDSELFDSAIEDIWSFDLGVRPSIVQIDLTDAEWLRIDDQTPNVRGLGDMWDRHLSLLRLASNAMQLGLRPDAESTDLEDAFLSAYALLLVVQNGIQEMLGMWGFEIEIWVSPGESIQAAIDRAWPGVTIYMEPGIYRESLYIDKDLILTSAPWRELPDLSLYDPELYRVILEPVASQVGITIGSSDSIRVSIAQITLRNASTAIAVSGNAHVSARDLWIQKSGTGVDVSGDASLNLSSCILEYFDTIVARGSDSASLEISSCYLERGEIGVRLLDEATLKMTDCNVGMNEIDLDLQGGRTSLLDCQIWDHIRVSGEASLEMIDTSIHGSSGPGIVASDHAQLSLSGGYITGHDGDGILLTGASTLDMRGVYCAKNEGYGVRALSDECPLEGEDQPEPFSGTIAGANNIIPAKSEYMGNELGGTCPAEYEFLTNSSEDE